MVLMPLLVLRLTIGVIGYSEKALRVMNHRFAKVDDLFAIASEMVRVFRNRGCNVDALDEIVASDEPKKTRMSKG
jgi:hypothetical protein